MTEEEKLAEEYFKTTYPSYIGFDTFTRNIEDAVIYGLKARIKWHKVADGDLPELSGEMRAERHCVLAYTKSLGWTQAIRRRVGKRAFEWVCSNYDGNTLFRDDEIVAWTELPEPEQLMEERNDI